jgi:hypothetical protein
MFTENEIVRQLVTEAREKDKKKGTAASRHKAQLAHTKCELGELLVELCNTWMNYSKRTKVVNTEAFALVYNEYFDLLGCHLTYDFWQDPSSLADWKDLLETPIQEIVNVDSKTANFWEGVRTGDVLDACLYVFILDNEWYNGYTAWCIKQHDRGRKTFKHQALKTVEMRLFGETIRLVRKKSNLDLSSGRFPVEFEKTVNLLNSFC